MSITPSQPITLNQLECGYAATVVSLTNPDLLGVCKSLGIIPGATVEVLRRAPGKGPLQIKVLGTLYALRQQDALGIQVACA